MPCSCPVSFEAYHSTSSLQPLNLSFLHYWTIMLETKHEIDIVPLDITSMDADRKAELIEQLEAAAVHHNLDVSFTDIEYIIGDEGCP